MPPIPVPYTPRPFVGDRYEPHDRTPEYMRQSTRDEVEMMRRQGDRSAQMWSGIGQEISGTLRDIAAYPDVIRQRQMAALKLQEEQDASARARWKFAQEQKAAAQQEADQDKLNGLLQEYGGRPPADRIVREFGPLRGTQVNKWLDDNFGSPKDAAKRGADIVKDMGGYGPLSENAVDDVMQSPDAGRVRYSFGPGMANGPEVMPNRAQQDAIDLKNAVQAKGGFVQPNGTINWGPPKPAVPKEPEIGSFSDYVTRKYGPRPTPAQIESARRTWEDTGRAPQAAALGDESVAMSPDAIDEAAHRVRLYGPGSIPTRFNDSDKKRILNRSAEINKAIGMTPAAAAMLAAVQKADQSALTKITTQAASAEAFENKALQQSELVKSLSSKVDRTSVPLINGVLVSGKAALGDTPAHLLANALLTYTSEYAKIIEGSTGSSAGSSDAARRAAAELISTALSKGTLSATVDQMNREMAMTRSGYRTTIDDIRGRMGGGPSTPDLNAQPSLEDLAGLKPGMGRRFTDGPFKGQQWSIGANGKPYRVGG